MQTFAELALITVNTNGAGVNDDRARDGQRSGERGSPPTLVWPRRGTVVRSTQ
jgi:hypothetical protein